MGGGDDVVVLHTIHRWKGGMHCTRVHHMNGGINAENKQMEISRQAGCKHGEQSQSPFTVTGGMNGGRYPVSWGA